MSDTMHLATSKGVVYRHCDDETPWQFTEFGGYPLYYVTLSGDVLCPTCAARSEDCDLDDRPVEVDTHMEGRALECADCHRDIESAYGSDPGDEEVDAEASHPMFAHHY